MSAPMSSKVASDAEHTNLPIVRTLKPPPEIWELVHPVESKQFNPPNRGQIASVTGLNLGMPFHEEDLDKAVSNIRRLMATKRPSRHWSAWPGILN